MGLLRLIGFASGILVTLMVVGLVLRRRANLGEDPTFARRLSQSESETREWKKRVRQLEDLCHRQEEELSDLRSRLGAAERVGEKR